MISVNEIPIRVNVNDPRIWRNETEDTYFACLGDVRMPTKYPVDENGLQYDRVQDKYFFADGSPCSFHHYASFVSRNGNWILFQKDSVFRRDSFVCVIDSLHFTERVIDPAPRRCYVDSNGRVIEYDYTQGDYSHGYYRYYDTKELVKRGGGPTYRKGISFHEKYVLIVRDDHIEFCMDNEQIARRYVYMCSHAAYIYFYKGIVYTSRGHYIVNNCAQRQLIVLCTIVNSDIAMYVSQFLLL
jgi:hypothetical protein